MMNLNCVLHMLPATLVSLNFSSGQGKLVLMGGQRSDKRLVPIQPNYNETHQIRARSIYVLIFPSVNPLRSELLYSLATGTSP